MDDFETGVRRARNVIWNASGNYSTSPAFLACSGNDSVDFYLNNIIGLTYRHFSEKNVNDMFGSFIGYEDQTYMEKLAWTAFEDSVFRMESGKRPALAELRIEFAECELASYEGNVTQKPADNVLKAKYSAMKGEKLKLAERDRTLFDALVLPEGCSAETAVDTIKKAVFTYFGIDPERHRSKRPLKKWEFTNWHLRKQNASVMIHDPDFIKRYSESTHSLEGLGGSGLSIKKDREKKNREKAREQIRKYFGEPVFSRQETELFEKGICTGGHRGVSLYFAGIDVNSSDFDEVRRKHIENNIDFYRENRNRFRNAVNVLTQLIRNAILTQEADDFYLDRTGLMDSTKAWRGSMLGDERVFQKKESKTGGDLCVTFLLDASSSQKAHQEIIASEAYIIAEALRKNRIDTQILTYSSLSGFTIINLLKERSGPHSIPVTHDQDMGVFGYTAMGCSRDGLVFKAVRKMIDTKNYRYNLLLVLTDACPNDDAAVPYSGEGFQARQYTGKDAVRDTAAEVRRIREDNITTDAIVFSEDGMITSAKEIYGSGYVRIRKLDELAGAAGRYIQSEIAGIYEV